MLKSLSKIVFILSLSGIMMTALFYWLGLDNGKTIGLAQEAGKTPLSASSSSVPLSALAWAGDTLYVSGKGSRDPATGEHPQGIEAQVRQALENCGASLKEAGLTFGDAVNSNVYLTNIENFQVMNKVYKSYFPQNPPARTTIAVPALPGDSQVEITLIASRQRQRKYIYPEGLEPSPGDLFTPAVLDGELLYLSGQGSRNYKTKEFPAGEFEAHVRQTLDNLGAVLKAAGLDFSNVVKSDVYLTDMQNIGRMNEVYKSYFKTNPPARTTVGVAALPGGPPIEIAFVALKGGTTARKDIIPSGSDAKMPFTPGVMVGERLFPSGKAGFSKGGTEAQVKEVMDGLGEILKAGGMDFSNVVEGKVYLADIQDYGRMNQIYGTYFPARRPARTCIAVSNLVGGSRVEITLVANKQRP